MCNCGKNKAKPVVKQGTPVARPTPRWASFGSGTLTTLHRPELVLTQKEYEELKRRKG